jgi:hypothetical protein
LTHIYLRVRLNLWLFMHILARSFFLVIVLASPVLVRKTQSGDPAITSPRPGDVLQGAVTVTGSSIITGFVSAEISFAYTEDPTGTWFLIAMASQPVQDGTLATWDTTSISDGNYILRLRISLADGTTRETIVPGLRVRNYTPVETPTPMPIPPQATPIPTITLTASPYPTPTSLARNPAVLVPTDVSFSIIYGGSATCLLFIIIGVYLWLRRKLK